jgi:hypothetical protein
MTLENRVGHLVAAGQADASRKGTQRASDDKTELAGQSSSGTKARKGTEAAVMTRGGPGARGEGLSTVGGGAARELCWTWLCCGQKCVSPK